MQNVVQQSVENSFYTQALVPGAFLLTGRHVEVIKKAYPQHLNFINDVVQVLTQDGLSVQSCLLAHFIVLKDSFDRGLYSVYARDNLTVAEIKFSFVNVSETGSLQRYETKEQQMLRRAFLTFNMRSANRKALQQVLASYGLQMATMGDCSCCILPASQLDLLENSDLYIASNVVRSSFNAQAVVTKMVSLEQLNVIDADINAADIATMHKLSAIIKQLAEVDSKESEEVRFSAEFYSSVAILTNSYKESN